MEQTKDQPNKLRDLLRQIRNGYSQYAPVLIKVQDGQEPLAEATLEHTVTKDEPLDWAEHYATEYSGAPFLEVGENSLQQLDTVVTVGRSRSCVVRVENESVSKVHATIVFDRSAGSYFLTDECSRNGTCINGEPLVPQERTPLWSGAYMSFGDAVYVFIDPPTLRKLSRIAIVEERG